MKDRAEAWELVCDYVNDDGLRRHMLAVSAAMGWYAAELDANIRQWEIVGLLHDFDWEIHPDLTRHPIKGADILRERGWGEEIIRIILSHATEGTGVERQKPVDFGLLACDEITGLIIATTLVRPSRDIREVQIKSIRKKWKNLKFAAGVDRNHVESVTADFSRECFEGNLDLWSHIANVLAAMQENAAVLNLDGQKPG